MIMGPKSDCCACQKKDAGMIWSDRKEDWMCIDCIREYHPPWMTLIKFSQGSIKQLWNLEVGVYEDFKDVEDIEWCGWIVRSKQEVLYRLVPRVQATVYHMEYFGSIVCGRCVDYKFLEGDETCLAAACEKAAYPKRSKHEIEYPPVQSRYVEWTNPC